MMVCFSYLEAETNQCPFLLEACWTSRQDNVCASLANVWRAKRPCARVPACACMCVSVSVGARVSAPASRSSEREVCWRFSRPTSFTSETNLGKFFLFNPNGAFFLVPPRLSCQSVMILHLGASNHRTRSDDPALFTHQKNSGHPHREETSAGFCTRQ